MNNSMKRDRPYNGQNHTDFGERGRAEVHGITFRDLRDCFIRAVGQASGPGKLYNESEKGEDAVINENDIYKVSSEVDIIAVQQCLCCEVEKIMGIFPNLPNHETGQ